MSTLLESSGTPKINSPFGWPPGAMSVESVTLHDAEGRVIQPGSNGSIPVEARYAFVLNPEFTKAVFGDLEEGEGTTDG